jgi:hypothetical protein
MTRPVAPVADRVAEIAALIRRDARKLRRAIEKDDENGVDELLTHLLVLADELAASPTALGL